jgi:hypothetical protein
MPTLNRVYPSSGTRYARSTSRYAAANDAGRSRPPWAAGPSIQPKPASKDVRRQANASASSIFSCAAGRSGMTVTASEPSGATDSTSRGWWDATKAWASAMKASRSFVMSAPGVRRMIVLA